MVLMDLLNPNQPMKTHTLMSGALQRIVLLLVYIQFQCMLTDSAEVDVGIVSCVITHRSWIDPDRIIIQWQWRNQPNTTDWSAAWYSDLNMGQCSQSTLNFCMCRYGDANCMDFGTYFEIRIKVDKRTYTLPIDPDTCLKPPKLDSMSVLPVNSTCIELTWYYNKTEPTFCSDYIPKVYNISYRENDSTLQRFHVVENVRSCNGSYLLCGLAPFTQYAVDVRCKFTDYLRRAVGHWSDPAENMTTTLQSVPSGAPNMSFGGFSHIKENCETDRRTVRVYWQPVDPRNRNGIITSYHIHVFSYHDASKVLQSEIQRPGETIHVDLELKCSKKYALRLSAATIVGVSSFFSEMDIPGKSLDEGPQVLDVIPIVAQTRSWNVTWKLQKPVSDTVSRLVVFWCLKSLSGECTKSIEWSNVPINSTSLTVSPSPRLPLHYFMVGTSTGSHGITWTTCQFAADKVPHRPTGVRLVPVPVGGALSISWENSPCQSRLFGPYIDHFKIYMCTVLTDKDRNCSGNSSSVEVDHDSSSYFWSDLDSDIMYKINIVAIGSENTASPPSNDLYGTATARSNALINDKTIIAVSVPMSVVVFIGLAVIFIWMYRLLRRRRKNKSRVLEILVPSTLLGQRRDDTDRLSENHELHEVWPVNTSANIVPGQRRDDNDRLGENHELPELRSADTSAYIVYDILSESHELPEVLTVDTSAYIVVDIPSENHELPEV